MTNTKTLSLIATILSTLIGCAPAVKQPQSIESIAASMPELVNHTPFPATLAHSESDDGRLFYAGIIKVTLSPYSDGSWRFDQKQEEITTRSVMSTECPTAPDFINDVVPFRKMAEIYVRPNKNDGRKVTLKVGALEKTLSFRNGCRLFESPADVVLVPYLEDGIQLSVTGMNGATTKTFPIPEGLAPFLIVRYMEGQIIFTPTRLDTVSLDTAGNRMILVYRSSIPVDPTVRKVEFAAVLQKAMRTSPDPREGLRDEAIVRYLKSCPVPTTPIEPCSLPETKQDPKLFDVSRW